jgi:polar amino acid transport system substrate-binding protein
MVKDGEAEGMMVGGRNKKRESWVRFSQPVFRVEYGFFVQSNDPIHYKLPADVQGYKVGVFATSNTATFLHGMQQQTKDVGLEPMIPVEIGFSGYAMSVQSCQGISERVSFPFPPPISL